MMELPNKKYNIIYADPPWRYKNIDPPCLPKKQPETCKVTYYYKDMSLQEIKELSIQKIIDKNCVLFLWISTPMLPEGLEVMHSWGFKYKTMLTWEKTDNDCMGYWFRVCTEHLLVGVKGHIKAFRSMKRTCYHEKRKKHSVKPDYFRDLIIEVCGDVPRIELFARKRYDGWDAWGDQLSDTVQHNLNIDGGKTPFSNK